MGYNSIYMYKGPVKAGLQVYFATLLLSIGNTALLS